VKKSRARTAPAQQTWNDSVNMKNQTRFNLKDAPPAMCFDEFLGKSCFLLRATYKIVSFLCFG